MRFARYLPTASLSAFPAFQLSQGAPSIPLLLSVVLGLPIALWSYKCLMLVLFQRKIIYMGYVPLGARKEKLSDFDPKPIGFSYEEATIPSSNNVQLSALIMAKSPLKRPDCVLLYLQGNTGSPLHRIPVFARLLDATKRASPVVLAPAPRSYWHSTHRTPTQHRLLCDYASALRYAARRWPDTPIILYGHSLGGSIAVCLLAKLSNIDATEKTDGEPEKNIQGLILENPFSSIPDMVRALYTERWIPYRYLAPLAWDRWDALGAMRAAAAAGTSQQNNTYTTHSRSFVSMERVTKDMLVLLSEHDEVVPRQMGRDLFDARPLSKGDVAQLVVIKGALHENAWQKLEWMHAISQYIEKKIENNSSQK